MLCNERGELRQSQPIRSLSLPLSLHTTLTPTQINIQTQIQTQIQRVYSLSLSLQAILRLLNFDTCLMMLTYFSKFHKKIDVKQFGQGPLRYNATQQCMSRLGSVGFI